MPRPSIALSTLLLLSLCACTQAARVDTELPSVVPHGPLLEDTSRGVSSTTPVEDWWTLYDDPVLGRLVQEALRDNLDLKAAAARVAQARSVVDARKRARLPSTQVSAGAGYGSTLEDQVAAALDNGPVRTGVRYDAGLDFSWDTDINGRLGASVRAARASAEEVQARADGIRIDVATETARAYIDMCGYAARTADAQHSLTLLTQSVSLHKKILAAGEGNRLDVVRTQGLADEAEAAIPPLQSAHDNAVFELALLLGKSADALPPDATSCRSVPRLATPLPTGDIAGLLKRRPDVRAADDHLKASVAGVDIATADMYPSVSIGAGLLSSATSIAGLDDRSSMVWRIGPLLSWSFPNIAVARAKIAGAKADQRAALAQFDKSILRAITDVKVALASYDAALAQQAALQHASAQTSEALRLAQLGRTLGAATAIDLLDAERSDVAARLAVSASNANVAVAQIGLFRALGGGWQQPSIVDPKAISTRSGTSGSAP
ncbi:TolC family protein [Dyella sp. 20L07]|uniref:TolC family protein n=1 Tax=Dyella sp. 20L07 TaxID=3384240 RepID=UPI003D2D58BE